METNTQETGSTDEINRRVSDEQRSGCLTVTNSPNLRAQTEIIATVLIVAFTVAAASLIIIIGTPVLNDATQSVTTNQMEHAMTQFDAKAAQVALGGSSSQAVSLGRFDSAESIEVERSGWVRIRVINDTDGSVNYQVVNQTLGAVVYDTDDTTIAYQGGGVWRLDGENGTMVSPPETHYRGATLTFPIIVVNGEPGQGSIGGELAISDNGSFDRKFPTGSGRNPIESGKVTVTVHSEYYQGWADFFEERTDGRVDLNHAKKTATITLVTPAENPPVTAAVSATAANGELKLAGTGAKTDSYNSSVGPYSALSAKTNGTLETAGNLTVTGNADVDGNISSGAAVNLESAAASVDGEVIEYTTVFNDPHNVYSGTTQQINGINAPDTIDSFVQKKVDDIRSTNDNGGTSVIVNNHTNIPGSSAELGAGRYYFEHIDLQGNTLFLNTSDGDIHIAVEDYIRLKKSGPDPGTISVIGDGEVKVYLQGEDEVTVSGNDANLHLGQSGRVHVPGDRSSQFWLYGKKDFAGRIRASAGNPAYFTGVIYAPAGTSGTGDFYIKQGDVYGGVVTGAVEIGQWGGLHYDEALATDRPLPEGTKVVKITYMHVTVNRINVTG